MCSNKIIPKNMDTVMFQRGSIRHTVDLLDTLGYRLNITDLSNKSKIEATIMKKVFKKQKVKINKKIIRDITLVVLIDSDGLIRAGYSIKLPEDKENVELAKKIAIGRAMSDRTNLIDMEVGEGMDEKYILYAIAEHLIRKIEFGSIKIKGVK